MTRGLRARSWGCPSSGASTQSCPPRSSSSTSVTAWAMNSELAISSTVASLNFSNGKAFTLHTAPDPNPDPLQHRAVSLHTHNDTWATPAALVLHPPGLALSRGWGLIDVDDGSLANALELWGPGLRRQAAPQGVVRVQPMKRIRCWRRPGDGFGSSPTQPPIRRASCP